MIAEDPLVHAERLTLSYGGGTRALSELTFDISRGEFVALVGPSGCGKSSALRLVAGLLAPTSGKLSVAAETAAARRQSRLRTAFVFQDPTLLPWRTIEANVALPLELARRGRAERSRAARAALQRVGLADFNRHFPNQLSGGMRMRASLARALVVEPELLLLDEPFAALDDITRQELNEELSGLWELRRWTGLFVTHNIAEAVFLSQRILVMSARPGRIVGEVSVPFDYPRSMDLRSQAEFARLCGEVMSRLEAASR